jgi:hypothetical protein
MKSRSVITALLAIFLLLTACNLPTAPTPTQEGLSSTLAAQTLQVMMTEAGDQATANPIATATQLPATSTPVATQVQATNPPPSTSTATTEPLPCDAVSFVSDVTVPDGSSFAPGAKFTKTWRLKNSGVCTWTTSYAAVFVDGNSMGADPVINLPGSVPPGQVFDLTIALTAPSAVGKYRGNFKLRNPAGTVFGSGGSGGGAFYVDIKVTAPTSINGGYSFIDNMCSADWTNASGAISCTAKDGSSSGFVIRVDKPHLENGSVDDESALLTVPQQVTDGVIHGKYPALAVKTGDEFHAIVGCEDKATACDVRFQLDYKIDNGEVKNLGTWDEVFDKHFTNVSVDLRSLDGKNVRFILSVLAKGSASGDRALWLLPRITRLAPTANP